MRYCFEADCAALRQSSTGLAKVHNRRVKLRPDGPVGAVQGPLAPGQGLGLRGNEQQDHEPSPAAGRVGLTCRRRLRALLGRRNEELKQAKSEPSGAAGRRRRRLRCSRHHVVEQRRHGDIDAG